MTTSNRKPAKPSTCVNGRPRPPGVIEPGCLLTAEEARKRLGLGAWAWRQLRRAGLRMVRVSGRSFVLSDDLIRHFQQQRDRTP